MGKSIDREPVVRVQNLRKVYAPTPGWMRMLVRTNLTHEVVALEDVTLEVPPGQICAVVGPNGAGKSTMFRILVGLTTPTAGTARVAGHDAEHESEQARREIGWMPADDRSLFMRLTCFENLYFHGRMQGITGRSLRERIKETLSQVGLIAHANSTVFALSAGMRARLQLARALLARPALLILDEPTGTVDPVGSHQLLQLITNLVHEHQMAALISSHRLEEIEALHSHVVLLDAGKALFQGDLDELRRMSERPRIEIEFETAADATRGADLLTCCGDVDLNDGAVVQCVPRAMTTIGDVLTRLDGLSASILHLREVPLPLRDLLARMYREADAKRRAS